MECIEIFSIRSLNALVEFLFKVAFLVLAYLSRLLFQVCYILKVNFVGYKILKYRDLISNPNFIPFDALGDLGSRLIATSKELRHFNLINLTYSIFTAST